MTYLSRNTMDDTRMVNEDGSSLETIFRTGFSSNGGLGSFYTNSFAGMEFIDTDRFGVKTDTNSTASRSAYADTNGFGSSSDLSQSLQVTLSNGSSTVQGGDRSYYDNWSGSVETTGTNWSSFFTQTNSNGTSWGTNESIGSWSSGPVDAMNMPFGDQGINLMPEFGAPLMMNYGVSMPQGPAMSSPSGLPFAGAGATNDTHPPAMAFAYNGCQCSME